MGSGVVEDKTLEAICYNRGSLQLLDQRKLPLQTIYIEIKDTKDGWSAIREMVVRGAPAIAIAAALSLAVEVSSLMDFTGTPAEAASFLIEKLEYLVSSRPTAVNLSDAATKLTDIVRNAVATASEANTVFQVYTEAAEIMLKDDVASNKAIGAYGATFLRKQLKDSEKLCILTHCNTGSLATAGYGTALGVIRAIHSEGVLERAYCTETRPFNQGSRLTAFELVHDKIPATLIADSAAAALMKSGQVNAVIVGADRVAANGDTANKIGTYSLAVSAMHHGIPFYVAAPLTSIDLSLPSGDKIVIEERSPKELLHTHGGLGEQIAASGISVWNPAFDVTPAKIISGIITEKEGLLAIEKHDMVFSAVTRRNCIMRVLHVIQPIIQSCSLCYAPWNPFYVAAPLTSIDLSLPSGDKIVIEERSPKELLHTHGGLGEQIAASGISVWNPAFDVTLAKIMSLIITEKGVITRNGTNS